VDVGDGQTDIVGGGQGDARDDAKNNKANDKTATTEDAAQDGAGDSREPMVLERGVFRVVLSDWDFCKLKRCV
jgi:hypothetical protein